jgi:hypothetical protein
MVTSRKVFHVLVAFAFASPVLADQMPGPKETGGSTQPVMIPASPNATKHMSRSRKHKPKNAAHSNYIGPCGGSYVCYSGFELNCPSDSRPYESIPDDECYCYDDPVCK